MSRMGIAALAAVLASVSANATISVTSTTGDYASSLSAPNVITFDGANPLNGFTLSGSGYAYNNGSRPSGDTSDNFLGISGGEASLSNGSFYTNVAFYWGTLDNYNFIDLYSGADLIGTVDYSGISGDSYVNINSTTAFDRVSFRSGQCCFEIDNVSFSGATDAVPEPASWALMVLGFGSVGYAMRRRPGVVIKTA